MSLTPTDGPEVRGSEGQEVPERATRPPLSGRARADAVAVSLQRSVSRGWRSVWATVRTGFDRLLSPGLAASDQNSLADDAVEPPRCPRIDTLPARAFPLTYPARSYRLVDNDADLVAEVDDDTLRMYHPEGSDAWIRSDIWIDVQP
ncbi:hypothetical protein [Halapricum salinum]|uniref:Uncharacterized protein n=1 Tax=Halapricum salinum TaxID=1457250 RepID=A0A4D6HES8_9EURY|nr:hypothetical protein [Halapricum salinum]QCC52290.1 hypothetical protein DV733_14070 [Halapricum salinum]